ncbi:MAG: endonuclease/exonuclease/phosphatase family protein [Phycisphaeraceae bacterium]
MSKNKHLTITGLLLITALIAAPAIAEPARFRVATFNTSLSRAPEGKLVEDLATGRDPAARRTAEILQRIRPDIVLLQEVDHDPAGEAVQLLQDQYLGVSQNGRLPIDYPYVYLPAVNTGELADIDLDGDGAITLPRDAWGFGMFPGHFGFVVLSRYPLDVVRMRTFQRFLWADMPGGLRPDDPDTAEAGDYYSDNVWSKLRLSSKNHVDLPVMIDGRTIHLLLSHPTPPVFDGPEDRNGRRNHDEIRLWKDYLTGGEAASYIVDDRGGVGGLARGSHFVLLGDMNADPFDGDSTDQAVAQILNHQRVRAEPVPASRGAVVDAEREGGANLTHEGPAAQDTADFGGPGNLRVDYVLPSKTMRVLRSGVFWPPAGHPLEGLVETSDHRLVWMDLEVHGY